MERASQNEVPEEEHDDVDEDDEEYLFRVWFEKGEITIAEEE